MNEYYVKVNFVKGQILTNLKKLVQNDYNSIKLNFTFDKEGKVLFKMLYPDGTQYVDEIKNNELIFGLGILNQEGIYEYELSLYTEDGRLTDYATKSFEVRSELVNTDEIVTPDDRVPVLDNLINELNSIKQDVVDGKYNGEKGEKGDPGSVKFIVVNELPSENIKEDAIYMLPSSDPTEENTYKEYIYVNDTWESLGGASVQVNMENYFTKEETKTITGELENLSTEDKSNLVNAINEVAGNNVIDLYGITVNVSNEAMQYCYNTTEIKEEFRKIIQNIYDKGTNNAILNIYNTFASGFSRIYYNTGNVTKKPTSIDFMETLNSSANRIQNYVALGNSQILVYCSWNGDVVTVDSISRLSNGYMYLLSTTNTASYTPSSDYNPATKKYVDDAITTAITTTLESDY